MNAFLRSPDFGGSSAQLEIENLENIFIAECTLNKPLKNMFS